MFNSERFDFKILSVLRLQFGTSTRIAPARSYHALIWRIHGKAEVAKGDDRVRLYKNDITFVPMGYEYKISTITDEEVVVIHFDAKLESLPSFTNMHATHPEAFAVLFDKLLAAWQNRPCGFVYRIDSLFLSILEEIENQFVELHNDSLSFRIQRSVDMMHANIANPAFSVDNLSAEIGYCPSYFRRIFNSEIGVSPKEYLINIRIRHAVVLLESGYYSVEKVSELCGFTSAKYFSTAFKRTVGKSPSAYLSYQNRRLTAKA